MVGTGLLLVGFGFKIASVPFHMWAPDVYEGAPTTVTALMAAGVKAAAFGALLRVFGQALPALAADWQPAVAALAIVTMVVGQPGGARAVEPEAHAGLLVGGARGLPAGGRRGRARDRRGGGAVLPRGLRGGEPGRLRSAGRAGAARGANRCRSTTWPAWRRAAPRWRPRSRVYLISLTGVPVSAGFVGKFFLFRAAVNAGWTSLAVVGVLMSVVSAYYYLRVVVAMYMREPLGEDAWAPVPPAAGLALALSAAVVLGLGVYPGPVLAWARLAAQSLL